MCKHKFVVDPYQNQGIETIGAILYEDTKTATYKIALLRSLVDICSGLESESIRYKSEGEKDYAFAPYGLVAFKWIVFYWPLIENNIKQISARKISFESELLALIFAYKSTNFINPIAQFQQDFTRGYDSSSPIRPLVEALIRKVVIAIKNGPVKHAGDEGTFLSAREFYTKKGKSSPYSLASCIESFGEIKFSTELLVEMQVFGSLMSDAIALQWAHECVRLEKGSKKISEIIPHLFADIFVQRNQNEGRKIIERLLSINKQISCIYSGKKILKKFDVDHLLPYSIFYNNDLWNLVLSLPAVNRTKSDKILSIKSLNCSQSNLFEHWLQTREIASEQFCSEVEATLQLDPEKPLWKEDLFKVVSKQAELTAHFRKIPRWTYQP